MPISYVALSAYARDHGIAGAQFGDFLRMMHLIDKEFLEIEAQRAREAKQAQDAQ